MAGPLSNVQAARCRERCCSVSWQDERLRGRRRLDVVRGLQSCRVRKCMVPPDTVPGGKICPDRFARGSCCWMLIQDRQIAWKPVCGPHHPSRLNRLLQQQHVDREVVADVQGGGAQSIRPSVKGACHFCGPIDCARRERPNAPGARLPEY